MLCLPIHGPDIAMSAKGQKRTLFTVPFYVYIKGNDYRLVAALQYRAGALAIRFFGTHGEYDRIDAETV
jgi:mRNA-degrading endonuclease HigB of HigAB toxin-antitoxin module